MDQPDEVDPRRTTMPAALPGMCGTTVPAMHVPVVVKRGQTGHWPLTDDVIIQRIDALFHATPPQIAAMLVGSMFGRNASGADPARYDAAGRTRRS